MDSMKIKQDNLIPRPKSNYYPVRISELNNPVFKGGIATFAEKYSTINVANVDKG
jgi:hypothetical protein